MHLIFEDRSEMQRSLRKLNIREVFIRFREGKVRVTAVIDPRSMASLEQDQREASLAEEVASWKAEHFEVIRGEVTLDRRAGRESGG